MATKAISKVLKKLHNKEVVIDTSTSFLYLGTLKNIEDNWLTLIEADAHDINDSQCTKEKYIQDSLATGIKHNRNSCVIDLNKVTSISLLSEVKKF